MLFTHYTIGPPVGQDVLTRAPCVLSDKHSLKEAEDGELEDCDVVQRPGFSVPGLSCG